MGQKSAEKGKKAEKLRFFSANPHFFGKKAWKGGSGLLVRMFSGGVGVFHAKGWGPKSSAGPLKPRKSKLFGRISRDFWRDIPGVPEKLTKKVCVTFLAPILATPSACYRGPKPQKCPKWLGEGAKGLLDPGSKVRLHWCKRGLHRCKTGFGWCKRLLGDLCSLGPKHLLHPLLTTLGTFGVSGPCSRHSGSQPYSYQVGRHSGVESAFGK